MNEDKELQRIKADNEDDPLLLAYNTLREIAGMPKEK